MSSVLQVTLPVFALVACGWLAAKRRLLDAPAVDGVNAFVFWFALPAMLFRAVATQPLERIVDARFLLAWLAAATVLFVAVRALGRGGGEDPAQRTGRAFTVTHGNVGYLGLPLVAQLGDPAHLPAVVMAILVDILVVIVATIVLFELARGGRDAGMPSAARLRAALAGLLRTPLVIGIAAGLVFAAAGLRLPPVADAFVGLLAQAAGPCALFAIGASFGGRAVRVDRGVTAMVGGKLLVHPLLFAAFAWAIGVDARLAAIGILAAALPSASNAYILSQRYGVDVAPISAAIVAGTVAAALTVSFVLRILALP